MIFIQLFVTFAIIGAFTFGGGYAMIALIQREVVQHHAWLSASEFTDLLAISQMTPGPIGINTATYAGYASTVGAGYPPLMGIAGALLASVAVILLPMTLAMVLGRLLLQHKDNAIINSIFKYLRLAIVGVIAAAALSLLNAESFGQAGLNARFLLSVAIFGAVFVLSLRRKANPILLILCSGAVGLLTYVI